MITGKCLIEIRNLTVGYHSETGFSKIISNLNLCVNEGIILGIPGESGSGKSTLAQAIYNSLKYPGEIVSGAVIFNGNDMLRMEKQELQKIRGTEISFIPQAAMNALNPVKRIRYQFYDFCIAHGIPLKEVDSRIGETLKMVRLDEKVLDSFPHELSGGMKQRVVIAISLLLDPKLVILDEPTTGLDVLVEHEILKDLRSIQKSRNFTMIFITHDLSILYEISDRIAMMYAGEIVEIGTRDEMLNDPRHPYNFLLLKNVPRIGQKGISKLRLIGNPGNYNEEYPGCQFYTRCPFSNLNCSKTHPELFSSSDDHEYRCIRYPEWKSLV